MCTISFTTSIFRRQLRTIDLEAGRVHKKKGLLVSAARMTPTPWLRYFTTRPRYSTARLRYYYYISQTIADKWRESWAHTQTKERSVWASRSVCALLVLLLAYFADNCGQMTWKLGVYTKKGAISTCRRAAVKWTTFVPLTLHLYSLVSTITGTCVWGLKLLSMRP
jgi:hypothetical protein